MSLSGGFVMGLSSLLAISTTVLLSGGLAFASDVFPNSIRVSVFPHIFKYSAPQKAETNVDEVTFESQLGCRAYNASNLGALEEFAPLESDKPVLEGKSIKITLSMLGEGQALQLICSGPTQLVREKGLKSYRYSGQFVVSADEAEFRKGSRRFVRVVNILPMEEYLKGVVPSEMPVAWPEKALRAQAIAARTYAYYELVKARKESPNQRFDVDDTVLYQAYNGLEDNAAASTKAVEATAGMLMTYRGEVIKSYFHANSAGHTEDANNVWDVPFLPYAVGKPEAYDPKLDNGAPWKVEYTLEYVTSLLENSGHIEEKSATVTGVSIPEAERNKSGRVQNALVSLSDGRTLKMHGALFAQVLKLRSTLFTATSGRGPKPTLLLTGHGFGHGVGMAQVGAKILAASLGWDETQILSFYYTGIEFTLASGQPLPLARRVIDVLPLSSDWKPVSAVLLNAGYAGYAVYEGYEPQYQALQNPEN